MKSETLEQWSESRNTSVEISEAIHSIATKGRTPEEIWDDPTGEEEKRILEIAFSKTDESELDWGFQSVKR